MSGEEILDLAKNYGKPAAEAVCGKGSQRRVAGAGRNTAGFGSTDCLSHCESRSIVSPFQPVWTAIRCL